MDFLDVGQQSLLVAVRFAAMAAAERLQLLLPVSDGPSQLHSRCNVYAPVAQAPLIDHGQ